jgi:trimethylamine--corrinoid protein Co-methyltransferase
MHKRQARDSRIPTEGANRLKTEIWNPTLMDRQPWDVWEAAGSKTATDRIRAKLKKVLARHSPPPLPEGAPEKIAAILREVEARMDGR